MAWQRLKRICWERLVRPLLFVQDTPRSKAGGVALGVFVAFTPTVGVQMPIAFALATLLGVNQPLAVAMCWITNPLTVPPIYYFEYVIGTWLLDVEAIGSSSAFWRQWEQVSAQYPGYWERVTHLAGNIGFPLLLGSLPLSLTLGIVSYPLTLWYCARRARRVADATLHPVAGEILPEPAHDPLPGAEADEPNKVLRISDAARRRDDPGGGRTGRGPMGSAGILALPLLALPLAGAGCAEPRDRYSTRGEQAESPTEGLLPLWSGWADAQTLATLSPFHAARGRERHLEARLRGLTGAGPRTCLALHLIRFADGAPLALAEPPRIEIVTGSGRIVSLAPSEVVAGIADAGDAALLRAQLGAEALPELRGGQLVRLLVVLPGEVALETAAGVSVRLGGDPLALEGRSVPAVRWDEFKTRPSREGFERLAATVAVAPEEPQDDGNGSGDE